jgi:hypothetical protein
MTMLKRRLAHALACNPEDPLVTEAVAEVAMGVTIRVGNLEFSRISDSSLAITDLAGEVVFLDLDAPG